MKVTMIIEKNGKKYGYSFTRKKANRKTVKKKIVKAIHEVVKDYKIILFNIE